MKEIWDLYDINKRKIGKQIERGMVLESGEYHLAADIWVINDNDEIIVTQRHPEKDFGLLWECSGGAVNAGESSIVGEARELNEEIGLRPSIDEFKYIGTYVGDDYILETYLVNMNVEIEDLILQKEEVVSAKLVSPEEFKMMNNDNLVVPSVWDRFNEYKDQLLKKI